MKTIEEAAEDFKRDYLENNVCEITSEDAKKCFMIGAKWATSNLWINTKDELPFNNYINKLVKNTTLYVLCIDKNGCIWLDRMIKLKNEGWLWANTSEQPIAWMAIPDLKV